MITRLSTAASGGKAAKPIAGEVMAKAMEGTIEVLSYSHEVKAPRDAAPGQATGRRQYSPIIIRKRIDKATPLLAKALTDATPLTAKIEFYRGKPDSTQEMYYIIELQNVLVSGISVFGFEPEVLQAAFPCVLESSCRRMSWKASDATLP